MATAGRRHRAGRSGGRQGPADPGTAPPAARPARGDRAALLAAAAGTGDRSDPRQLRRHGQEPGQPRARQAPSGTAIRSHRSQYEGVSVNETQLIDELSAALDDVTAPLRLPAGAAGRARAGARRRLVTRGLAAAVPAAGLAAAAALLLAAGPQAPLTGPGAGGQARPGPGAHHPASLTVAYVTSQEKAA